MPEDEQTTETQTITTDQVGDISEIIQPTETAAPAQAQAVELARDTVNCYHGF